MEYELLAVMMLALPLLAFPAAFAWYVNTGFTARLMKRHRMHTLLSSKTVRERSGYPELTE